MGIKISTDNARETAKKVSRTGIFSLFATIGYILLAAVGACGDDCQGCALTGIAQTRNAIVNGTAENAFAEEK
jgi:hypothetical protein